MEKVNKDVALAEFDRFTSAMDLDVATVDMDQDDLKTFNEIKSKIVNAMIDDRLVINEKGEPVFTPTGMDESNALTFYEPTGAVLMSMDRRKEGQDMGKMFVLMSAMTKSTDSVFSTMPNRDIKVCSAIVAVFLG